MNLPTSARLPRSGQSLPQPHAADHGFCTERPALTRTHLPPTPGQTLPAAQPALLAVAAVVLGNALEFFDFVIYATFAVIIGQVFFPSDTPYLSLLASVTTFGVGFIARPLGAWLIGAYADRAGRKPAMLLTVLVMGISTGLFALLPGYQTLGIAAPVILVVLRLLQGLAWGGEAGPATTYVLEAAPLQMRGRYACWQVVAQGIAGIVAGIFGYALATWLSPAQLYSWGWRIPFLFGVAVLPIGILIRRRLHDTIKPRPQASTTRLTAQLLKRHRRSLLLCLLILSGSTITQYFLNYMTIYAMAERAFPTNTAMLSTLFGGLALAVSALLGGWMCDRYGRRPVIIWPRLLLLLLLWPAMQLLAHAPAPVFFSMLTLLTLLHGISGAALIVLLAESFPRAVRATGFSLVYALGVALFGGSAQPIITWLIEQSPGLSLPTGYLLLANVVCIAAACLARETRPCAPR